MRYGYRQATRNTDPITSHMAEQEFSVLGKRAVRCRQVLRLVCDYPNSTTGELARLMHKTFPELPIACAVESPHKRVVDLEDRGLVVRGTERRCADTGRMRVTWHPTSLGLAESGRYQILV